VTPAGLLSGLLLVQLSLLLIQLRLQLGLLILLFGLLLGDLHPLFIEHLLLGLLIVLFLLQLRPVVVINVVHGDHMARCAPAEEVRRGVGPRLHSGENCDQRAERRRGQQRAQDA
jgi:hypothetical protein